ncbi:MULTISPECIES: ribosome assembly cofactor RimP [Bizionia]|uniref:Ribosome maturation factor RimP n=1 Tax=Bizionia algoritergicola TaxID=291187 RepID=A0A5D0R1W8_9FLAO|nr:MULTISPECIES: ribosome assembly cofactor RimP [Bizionia]OBX23761.1 ribosome assembly cofactor RimP [Bizionia sp. APA-3]TYB75487.1 ribosome assembly cofactor RimP [Bizionia algoritergicola]
MLRKTIETLLNDALEEREDLFLIDFTMGEDNSISVIIDGDHGVTVDDCVFISRAIEHNIDREEHDFSLEVASGGATAPLIHARQYKKNIGRDLEIRTKEEEVTGQLTKATDTHITLEWKAREPKPVGKGKVTVQKEAEIAYQDIVEAKVMIKF